MGQPKKQTTKRRRGNRRSHIVLKLARKVNASSPVRIRTTKGESGARTKVAASKTASVKEEPKALKKTAAKAKKKTVAKAKKKQQ